MNHTDPGSKAPELAGSDEQPSTASRKPVDPNMNSEHPSETDMEKPEPVKFTAGGQLKATLFNSWVNVLLVAAPVGSMPRLFCSLRHMLINSVSIVALNFVNVSPVAVFVVNFIAIVYELPILQAGGVRY